MKKVVQGLGCQRKVLETQTKPAPDSRNDSTTTKKETEKVDSTPSPIYTVLRKANDVCIRVSHKGCQDTHPYRRSLRYDDPYPTSRQQISENARKERHPSPNRASTLSQLIYHLFCSKPAVFKRPSSFLSFLRRFYLSSIILLTTTLQFVFQEYSHSLYPTLIKPFDQHAFRRRLRLCHSRRCCRGFASDRFKRKHDSCSRRDQQQRRVVSKQKSK